MKFIIFLFVLALAAYLSFLTFSDTETFLAYGRHVVGVMAMFLWVCVAIWIFVKVEDL